MFLQVALGVLLLGCLCPVQVTGGDDSSTPPLPPPCEDPSVEAFAAAFYTALILTTHPIIFELEATGEEASELLYDVVKYELDNVGLCNAPSIARIVSRGAAAVKRIPLTLYFYLKGYVVGYFLLEKGLLDCKNAVELALKYFNFVRPILDSGLDLDKIDTYFTAITRGLVQHVQSLKLDLLDSFIILAYNFYDEFRKHENGV